MENKDIKDLVFELLIEKVELSKKCFNLWKFKKENKFNDNQKQLLEKQYEIMIKYEHILLERIEKLIEQEIKKEKMEIRNEK